MSDKQRNNEEKDRLGVIDLDLNIFQKRIAVCERKKVGLAHQSAAWQRCSVLYSYIQPRTRVARRNR